MLAQRPMRVRPIAISYAGVLTLSIGQYSQLAKAGGDQASPAPRLK
jgi:hypothetical protein